LEELELEEEVVESVMFTSPMSGMEVISRDATSMASAEQGIKLL
jgi:hypothetical protein